MLAFDNINQLCDYVTMVIRDYHYHAFSVAHNGHMIMIQPKDGDMANMMLDITRSMSREWKTLSGDVPIKAEEMLGRIVISLAMSW